MIKKSKQSAPSNVPFNLQGTSKFTPVDFPPNDIYSSCSLKSIPTLLHHIFDHDQWLEWFNNHKHPHNKPVMRCYVQAGTIDAFLRYKYFLKNGEVVKLNRKSIELSIFHTTFYASDHIYNWSKTKYGDDSTSSEKIDRSETVTKSAKTKGKEKLVIERETTKSVFDGELSLSPSSTTLIIEGDCLEVARWLKKTHNANPCLLNMASSTKPGGGYRNGTSSQEESLHRCSGLFHCLEDPYKIDVGRMWSYPIEEFGGIYSPNVLVIRKCNNYGYEFLSSPEKISIVSAWAYSNPPLETNSIGEVIISKKIAISTKHKMMNILNMCLENGHDSVVLSAFGCGVYRNPAAHIAKLWKEVLNSQVDKKCRKAGTFLEQFKFVVFAILNQKNEINPEGTLLPFAREFCIEPINLDFLLGVEGKAEEEIEGENDIDGNELN